MTRKLVKGYGEVFLPSDNQLDAAMFKEILNGRPYPKVASAADIIWDVGANIGASALYFSKEYPNATIVCFEPSTDIVWDCLSANTESFRSRCQLHPYGLADRNEERPMNEWRDSTVTRSCRSQTHELVVEIAACQFRKPPSVEGVTIVKIDTEGCELEILMALKAARHRVPVYYVEYHSESDRREIDRALPDHDLVRSHADRKHRGNLCYVHHGIKTVEDGYEIT